MKKSVFYTHDNATRSLREWAAIVGIKHSTLVMRLRAGWPLAKALTLAPQPEIIECAGEAMTVREWSMRTGIDPMTIRMRLTNGWSAIRALTTPVRPRSQKVAR